jgi:hypothetical protein
MKYGRIKGKIVREERAIAAIDVNVMKDYSRESVPIAEDAVRQGKVPS